MLIANNAIHALFNGYLSLADLLTDLRHLQYWIENIIEFLSYITN